MQLSTKTSITVGIPTYNRPEALVRRLRELESLCGENISVLVCDNSDEFHQEAQEICAGYPNWRYLKNHENIGFGPNLLRVLELTETEHLWWRGDDDVISPSQASVVTSTPLASDEILILDPEADHIFAGRGLEEFCRNFKTVQSMGWMSALVLPTATAKKSIEAGHSGTPSGYPHFSLVLNMLEQNPNLGFKVVPFTWEKHEFRDVGEKEGQRWKFFTLCIKGFSKTADTIQDKRIRDIYLQQWRNSQSFRIVRKMISLRLGLIRDEPIHFSTLSPLLSIKTPKSVLLFCTLYFFAKCPAIIPQALITLWSLSKSPDALRNVNLDFLTKASGFNDRLKLIKNNRFQ